MHRLTLVAALAAAAAVAAPSVAQGATLHPDGQTPHRILLQDAVGETNLLTVSGSKSVLIEDANAPITIAGVPTCMRIDERAVRCAAVRLLEIDLGAGPDNVVVDTPLDVAIEGGPGPDRYVAFATNDPSRVDFAGGIGRDTANYGYASAGVRVGVDLAAGDGRPGDDDQIRRDVETVLGSPFDDELTGSPRTETLAGADGDDRLTGGSGPELLRGGDGNDRIDARDGASDTVECGGWLLDWAAVDTADLVSGCTTLNLQESS